jgi:tetratricopeptide (TPR) repeat protein
MALGKVRAAQGRDLEAEELLRAAVEIIEPTHFRQHESETLEALGQFLRDRGRDDEADLVEERRVELLPDAPKSAERIA